MTDNKLPNKAKPMTNKEQADIVAAEVERLDLNANEGTLKLKKK